jgi:hypothetical protein
MWLLIASFPVIVSMQITSRVSSLYECETLTWPFEALAPFV